MESFLFYDLETSGTNPFFSRIGQFAAIRTDMDLNPIGEPMDWLIKPPSDMLPSPGACLVTGVNPWDNLAHGRAEPEVMSEIHERMSEPGTCTLGYNSYRFDDMFIRTGFYRNFLPIYRREYENGNSRWDLLNVFRAAYLLRSDGLEWPLNEKGVASFRLEDLAVANGVRDGMAHEALSDVRALIGLARKLRAAQPRFWAHAFNLRLKSYVNEVLAAPGKDVWVHVAGIHGFERHLCAPILPLFRHPTRTNDVVVFDLSVDPQETLDWTPDIPTRLPGLRTIRVNEGPMLFALKHLQDEERSRLGLDTPLIEQRAAWLLNHQADANFLRLVPSIDPERPEPPDVDGQVFSGFFKWSDDRWMERVRRTPPSDLAALESAADIDPRLSELLRRYRARNYPETLSCGELRAWKEFCLAKFNAREIGGVTDMNLVTFAEELRKARESAALDARQMSLLDEVERFAQHQVNAASAV